MDGGRVIRRHRKTHRKTSRKSHRKSRKVSRRRSRRGGSALGTQVRSANDLVYGQGSGETFKKMSAAAKKASDKFKNWIATKKGK